MTSMTMAELSKTLFFPGAFLLYAGGIDRKSVV